MKYIICHIGISLIFLLFSLPTNAQPSILGEWASFQNGGADSLEQGQCGVRLIEERRYTILPSKMDNVEFDAVYATILHWHWVVKKRPSCALPKTSSKNVYMQLRTWGIDVKPIAGNAKYKANAIFIKCTGDFCDNKEGYWQKPFETTLDFSTPGVLIDGATDKGMGRIVFRPVADLQRESNSISREFLDALGRLTPTSLGGFVDNRIQLTIIPRTRDDMLAAMEKYYRSRLENHSGYEIIQAYKLGVVKGHWPELPVTHVVVSHKQTDGTQFPETIDLVLDGATWKLLTLD